MRYVLAVAVMVSAAGVVMAGGPDNDDAILRRGDSNNDQVVNGSDVSHLSAWLFQGGAEPGCLNQADVNDDGSINGSDPVFLANWLYLGGPTPPAPGPYNFTCATDAHALGCATLPPACE